ncbi:MAG: IclR family transcriptional regulator [bacterium]
MGQHSGIGVLDKAVQILEAAAAEPAALAALVERTGLPRATTHRLAVALEAHDLLRRDSEGRFTLGAKVTALAAQSGVDPLLEHAAAVLAWLRDESGESAQLYRREGNDRVCVAVAERRTGLRTTVPIGARLPLTAGSGAQVLCAWEPPAALGDLLSRAQFSERILAEVRRRGWAQSVAQREAGVASVSAPVRGAEGAVLAAVSISGPIERLGRAPGQRFAPVVQAAARRLSRR